MENSNLTKQAKSDIFSELYPIINFYINKGATPQSLKKYYRNSKMFNDILDDIKNKGSNLITDDIEYKNLVKTVLNDILDDLIAKQKDDEYKNKQMKHLKEFNSYEYKNESFGLITLFAIGFFLYKFLKSILTNYMRNRNTKLLLTILSKLNKLKEKDKIQVIDLSNVYYIRLNFDNDEGGIKMSNFDIEESGIKISKFNVNECDIRVLKNEKTLEISEGTNKIKINLTNNEYNEFLKLIQK